MSTTIPATLPPKPDFGDAYEMVRQVYSGAASQDRARVIKGALDAAKAYINAVVEREERDINPWMINDCVAIYIVLKEHGIAGVIRLVEAPEGQGAEGCYSVETILYGKIVGTAAQLAEVFDLIGRSIERAQ